jgi:hypothetical protein
MKETALAFSESKKLSRCNERFILRGVDEQKMMQFIDNEEQMVLEKHAEREAIRRVRGASFAHCLTLNALAEDLEVIGKNGRPEKVHGKDIVSQKTWVSFLAKQTSLIELGGIAFTAGPLAVRYATWLRTQYTSRYRWFVREEEKAWLKQVALLAVLWHVLEHKQETNTFLDAWAALRWRSSLPHARRVAKWPKRCITASKTKHLLC